MMSVSQVLDGVGLTQPLPAAARSQMVNGIEYDSRRIKSGDIFFAFSGVNVDGRKFADVAIAQGAVAIVSELPPPPQFAGAMWIEVEHGRRALSLASRNLFGDVTRELEVTGITGTNGKTTTAYLTDAVMRASGRKTALVGTIEYRLAGEARPAANTTPESLDFYKLFAELREKQGTALTAEISSHALALGRVRGISFHTAVLTNVTRDHLDFHGTMETYFDAKCELFRGQDAPPPPFAVLNRDDEWAGRVPVSAETFTYWYGLDSTANVRAEGVKESFEGLRFRLVSPEVTFDVRSALVGRINVYNILAACATGFSYGLDPAQIAAGIADCQAVPGRFERIDAGQPFLVAVDYAHTDDALRNVIRVARAMQPKRVLTLFGCGGDRDRAKRPLMGKAAAEESDMVVLTSDNPRSEDPLAIMNDALVGMSRFDTRYILEPDRAKAIRLILEEAQAGDVVILAGKGHETYQIFRDKTIHFDDREVARAALAEMGYAPVTMSLEQVATMLGRDVAGHNGVITGWSIDSRTAQRGDLFFALPGERYDGHDYVKTVLDRGAVAAIVDRPMPGLAVLQVENTEAALQQVGSQAREWWGGTVIGVTGSAGKTSTKDIVAVLVGVEFATGKTVGNLNNHLGVPLSILRLPDTSRYAVLEMGMNHAGEIRSLCEIARPQVAVVTNVGYAHIENFESVEGIAAAKRELVEALPADGLAVLNYDDARVRDFAFAGKCIRYGLSEGADVRPDQVQLGAIETTFRLDGVNFTTKLTGRHSLSNILAGLTVAREFGMKLDNLRDAVHTLSPAKMRGERRQVAGMTILDDSYNSNPDAARAMLDVLAETPAERRIAVLGEMLELGQWSEELHRGVGEYAAKVGVTVLLGIRGAARHLIDGGRASGLDAGAALFFESPTEAGEYLRTMAQPGDAILFKGSRGTRVELALERFLEGR